VLPPSRQQQILDLEHYLDVLYRKPGALADRSRWNRDGRLAYGPPASIASGKSSSNVKANRAAPGR
jgi:hypothetical protein